MGNSQTLRITWYNKDKALIPTEQGKYGYRWVEPADPRYCETHYLEEVETVAGTQFEKKEGRIYSERADLTPQEDNLLILGESGDVLEALTRVPELKSKYVGKVKCVYIDPPFNTAQTFANYEDNLEHSVWLTMMRDRLEHLWKLLSNDGSIWVHLDDVENHRMRMLLDEVFGSGNFVAEVVWQKADSGRNDVAGFSVDHDVILVYGKSPDVALNRMARTVADNARFSNPDGDEKGIWFSGDRTAPGSMSGNLQHPSVFAIQHPLTGQLMYPANGRHWCFSQERIFKALSQYALYKLNTPNLKIRAEQTGLDESALRTDVRDMLIDESTHQDGKAQALQRMSAGDWPEFFVTETSFGRKSYPPEQGQPPRTWWDNESVGHNRAAKSEIKALFPGKTPFATPKPERLLERVIHIATNSGDIVLDVFAGSGTTAAVAQKMGRRWVTCELVEDTFDQFTRPRLEKVVRGEDMGGVSVTRGERIDATADGLPEGLSADDAQKLVSLLNKAVKNEPELKNDKAIKAVKALVKTVKSPDTINWRGGGGFTVAKLSSTCFDYLPELSLTVLTDAATGNVLNKSVAANLGFPLTDEPIFVGKRNREYLAVVEGVLTPDKVDDFMAQLPQGHNVVLAATELAEGVAEHVRSYKNGSSAVHIPSSLFSTSTRKEL